MYLSKRKGRSFNDMCKVINCLGKPNSTFNACEIKMLIKYDCYYSKVINF